MNQVSWSELRRISAANVVPQLPLEVLVDGTPTFVLSGIDDAIVVSDLHVRVKNKLRAMERRARAGMPKPVRIDVEDEE